ncbi:Na+/H+ antiporter subunit E [Isoptericola croceus]|uniref:Na+/H+ antiporter subunit E n=1 Tax=Isoptericola croceus TaxID=3031406 RepID=UPI0023F95D8E|nr:Na+/H+ antiporter subunit E [Isoptericola croceus]
MSWFTWPLRWAWFAVWFLALVVRSNFTVIWDTLTPGQASRPLIGQYASRCRSDAELTLLAIAITLTPGTLTLGTRTEESGTRTLYVHGMYDGSPEGLAASVRRIEDKLFSATRRKGTA